MPERRAITVSGVVQGVGFRPFVYRLASETGLAGHVQNGADGVRIEGEGEQEELDAFLTALRGRAPPLARVDAVEVEPLPPRGEEEFWIRDSGCSPERDLCVPPDTAPCPACLEELWDPGDRRHRYPFLSCTRCGPRFTIVRGLPYDRPRTSMAGFPLCSACREEYEDPGDRRFHAQPTACPDCGPRPWLEEATGETVETADPIGDAAAALRDGRLLGVKGRGGYHIACDALDPDAVSRLRRRKGRPARPLAVMAPDGEWIRSMCRIREEAEREALASPRRPIVLLQARADAPVADGVAPGVGDLGVMLPYTPLHHLLVEAVGAPLVLTSGNDSGEPIVYRDDARDRLREIVDLLLVHDRAIETRCDDSVVRVMAGGATPIRRSRGWVPEPVDLPEVPSAAGGARPTVLAVGGHLKNTFCLSRGRTAYPSQHVGDLESPDTFRALREGVDHFLELFGSVPDVIARDAHPDYLSTRLARELADRFPDAASVAVQHHHAHVAGCVAEHGRRGPVLGLAFDGTGYGPDDRIWGGELLLCDGPSFERLGHLRYTPLPGGEAAIREPWRSAAAHLRAACGPDLGAGRFDAAQRLEKAVGVERWKGVRELMRRDVNCPRSSSVGRLFDAAASLLGLRHDAEFQAQAAMELEAAADPDAVGRYPVEISDGGDVPVWDPSPTLVALLQDRRSGADVASAAARFHRAVAEAAVELCRRALGARSDADLDAVALSGGVFQNRFLTRRTARDLEAAGFEPLLHRRVPPNDGGLSYGQAAVAAARFASESRPAKGDEPGASDATDRGGRRPVEGGSVAAADGKDGVCRGRTDEGRGQQCV